MIFLSQNERLEYTVSHFTWWMVPWRRLLLTLPPQQRTIPRGLASRLA